MSRVGNIPNRSASDGRFYCLVTVVSFLIAYTCFCGSLHRFLWEPPTIFCVSVARTGTVFCGSMVPEISAVPEPFLRVSDHIRAAVTRKSAADDVTFDLQSLDIRRCRVHVFTKVLGYGYSGHRLAA